MNKRRYKKTKLFGLLLILLFMFLIVGEKKAYSITLINGSFEQPQVPGSYGILDQSIVPGWSTIASDGKIEFQKEILYNVKPVDGLQYAELNANQVGALYQNIATIPGKKMYWQVYHRGSASNKEDTALVEFGPPSGTLKKQADLIGKSDKWTLYKGLYTVPAGQTVTRFQFRSVTSATGPTSGNYLDDIRFAEHVDMTETSQFTKSEVQVGEDIVYKLTLKNDGALDYSNIMVKLCISKSLDYEADSIVSSIGKVSSENFDSDTNELTFNLDELPIDNKNEISINFKGNKATESATITGNVVYTDKNFDDIKTYNTDISESKIFIVGTYLLNGSFEQPQVPGSYGILDQSVVPGWSTTASDGKIEFQKETIYDVKPVDGLQYAELNANQVGALYQNIATIPGKKIYWQVYHRGSASNKEDTALVEFGPPSGTLKKQADLIGKYDKWTLYKGLYTVPAGQTVTRFQFRSVTSATGPTSGNYLDDIRFAEHVDMTETSQFTKSEVQVGEDIVYKLTLKNDGALDYSNIMVKLCISKNLDYEADSIVSSIGKVSSENFDSDTNELTFNLDELPIDNKNEISINFKGNKATKSATITGNVVYTDKNFDDIKTYNTDISESNIEITPKPTAPLIVQFVDETGESLHSNITFVRAIGTTINMTEEEEVQQALQAILAENYQLVQKPENETQVPVLSEESTVQYKFRGTIYFKSVPENLSFGSISLIDSHVSVNQPKYKEPLVVKDTRKEKTPWKLSVTVKQPLTSVQDSKQILYRAIRYKKNDATMVNLSQDEEQLVDQGAISANGEYNVSEKWEKNKSGLVLNVFKNEVSLKGAYQAKLLWKIAETP